MQMVFDEDSARALSPSLSLYMMAKALDPVWSPFALAAEALKGPVGFPSCSRLLAKWGQLLRNKRMQQPTSASKHLMAP